MNKLFYIEATDNETGRSYYVNAFNDIEESTDTDMYIYVSDQDEFDSWERVYGADFENFSFSMEDATGDIEEAVATDVYNKGINGDDMQLFDVVVRIERELNGNWRKMLEAIKQDSYTQPIYNTMLEKRMTDLSAGHYYDYEYC